MNPVDDQKIDQNREEFYIDTFRPDDAQGIVRLFRTVYGEHYPIQIFYDPQSIIAVNEAGKYYSIVARTVSGSIIGVVHLFRSAPHPSTYEAGDDYRVLGILEGDTLIWYWIGDHDRYLRLLN